MMNAEIILKNPRRPELEPVKVSALADTAAVHLCIPPHVQIQLEYYIKLRIHEILTYSLTSCTPHGCFLFYNRLSFWRIICLSVSMSTLVPHIFRRIREFSLTVAT